MRILFTGGGTGGHVVPIIAIAREMKKIYQGDDLQLFFIGPYDAIGSNLLLSEGIRVKNIMAGKIRRYSSFKSFFQNMTDIIFKIPAGVVQSFFYIFFLSPDLIFSKGGFGSIPPVIASRLLFVPVFLHESDVTPGFANKVLRGFALEIFTSFPKTEHFSPRKLITVGNPIRKELLNGSEKRAKKFFGIESEKPILLIIGGSQGSQRVNDEIMEVLPQLLEKFEVIHQCGERNYGMIKSESKVIVSEKLQPFYHLHAFLLEEELRHAYAATNLIIGRAGSGTIFEIAASGKPSILVPLPEAAQNHQLKNAYAYQESGATIVIEENNFSSHFFLEKLRFLFDNPQELKKMSEKAKEFSKPEAGWIIAHYLIEYLTK